MLDGNDSQVFMVKIVKHKEFAASVGIDKLIYVWDIFNESAFAVLPGYRYRIRKIFLQNDKICIDSLEMEL